MNDQHTGSAPVVTGPVSAGGEGDETPTTAAIVTDLLRAARATDIASPGPGGGLDARRVVELAARSRASSLATAPVLDDAAALLQGWQAVAVEHGVAMAGYYGEQWIDRLARIALEMAGHGVRDIYPHTVDAAVSLLQALVARLAQRGITTALHDAVVPLPRTATSPAWGVDGQRGLAIGVDIDWGWTLHIDQPQGSPVVEVVGRCDTDGIDAVLDLADTVNTGTHGLLFRW